MITTPTRYTSNHATSIFTSTIPLSTPVFVLVDTVPTTSSSLFCCDASWGLPNTDLILICCTPFSIMIHHPCRYQCLVSYSIKLDLCDSGISSGSIPSRYKLQCLVIVGAPFYADNDTASVNSLIQNLYISIRLLVTTFLVCLHRLSQGSLLHGS